MSTSLVVTGGTAEAQYDTRLPRPALDEAALEEWLLRQPEYSPGTRLWRGSDLTGEDFTERANGALLSVSVNISRRGTTESDEEFEQVRRRLGELAHLLGARVWDDDAEAFTENV